jgi:hypothetical protein
MAGWRCFKSELLPMMTPTHGFTGGAEAGVVTRRGNGEREKEVSREEYIAAVNRYGERGAVLSTTTEPPFITHRTLSMTTLMSASGSPSTAVMSAK